MAVRQFVNRQTAGTIGVAIAGIGLYGALLAVSARISALPTSHHSAWVATLAPQIATRTQLELVYAATRWYEMPVLASLAAALIGIIAQAAGVKRSALLFGTFLWVAIVVAVAGGPSLPDLFALVLAAVTAIGGAALFTTRDRSSEERQD